MGLSNTQYRENLMNRHTVKKNHSLSAKRLNFLQKTVIRLIIFRLSIHVKTVWTQDTLIINHATVLNNMR